MGSTAIILLNFNSFDDTFECINSILSSRAMYYSIIVVDNDSRDDSLERLQNAFSGNASVRFIASQENLGFSGGCNIGIQKALEEGFEYILLLNNDTLVTDDFLTPLLDIAKTDDTIGIVGGKTFFHDYRHFIWDAGGFISHTSFRGIRRNEKDKGIDEIGEVGFVTCCLALVKAAVFQKIGMLSEAYFFGSEEWEFSLRAHRAGFTLMYTPHCVIYHKVGRSHDYRSPKMLYNTYRNRILFVKRNYNWLKYFFFMHLFLFVKCCQRTMGIGQLKDFSWKTSLRLLKRSYLDSIKYNKVVKLHWDQFDA